MFRHDLAERLDLGVECLDEADLSNDDRDVRGLYGGRLTQPGRAQDGLNLARRTLW